MAVTSNTHLYRRDIDEFKKKISAPDLYRHGGILERSRLPPWQ